jgi:hypothetical protein
VLTKALKKPYLTHYKAVMWEQRYEMENSQQLMRLMVPQLRLWRIDAGKTSSLLGVGFAPKGDTD